MLIITCIITVAKLERRLFHNPKYYMSYRIYSLPPIFIPSNNSAIPKSFPWNAAEASPSPYHDINNFWFAIFLSSSRMRRMSLSLVYVLFGSIPFERLYCTTRKRTIARHYCRRTIARYARRLQRSASLLQPVCLSADFVSFRVCSSQNFPTFLGLGSSQTSAVDPS